MDKSSQSICNSLLAVKVRGFICANAPVPHGGCPQNKAVLGFIWSSCAAILHRSNLHSFMVLVQLLKRNVLSSPLCQAPVVFEEGRIGWRCWVLWSCWRGIRWHIKTLSVPRVWIAFLPWSSCLLQNTTKSVHKETHPKIQNWSLAQLLHFY